MEENFRFVEYYDETTEPPLLMIPNCTTTTTDTFDGNEICNLNSSNFEFNGTYGTLTGLNILFMSITTLVLGLIILVTIIGNVFVILAVVVERNLQSVANRLIVSLALADLLVACLVMPLSAVNEVLGKWVLGNVVCYIWTSSDVLLCTASILHLLAIAVDRFWAVTDIEYTRNRNKTRINTMIFLIWLVSGFVSLPPLLGWRDSDFDQRIIEKKCLVSQDIFYQIFATMSTFYVPLFAILILYWKIWKEATKRIRHRPGKITLKPSSSPQDVSGPTKTNSAISLSPCPQESSTTDPNVNANDSPELLTPVGDNHNHQKEKNQNHHSNDHIITSPSSTVEVMLDDCSGGNIETVLQVVDDRKIPMNTLAPKQPNKIAVISSTSMSPNRIQKQKSKKNKETIESKREKKAQTTLAIITGVFIVCWLPFFFLALFLPICGDFCYLPDYVMSIFLWLGYINSSLNPVIYTLFSPEFRNAFKKILFGSKGRRKL